MRFVVAILVGLGLLTGCTADNTGPGQPTSTSASSSSTPQELPSTSFTTVRPTASLPASVVQTRTAPDSFRCADDQVSVVISLSPTSSSLGTYQDVTVAASINRDRTVSDLIFDQPASDFPLMASALIVGTDASKNQQVIDLSGILLNNGLTFMAGDFNFSGQAPTNFELCIMQG